MSRKSERPQTRRHVMIYDEDWEFLEANYGAQSENRFGVGTMIKRITHTYVKTLKQKIADRLDSEAKNEH